MLILVISNIIGIRNTIYYGIIGIGGLWLAFLMSGVHATIAAVMAAMTIPVNVKVSDKEYIKRIKHLIFKFEEEEPNNNPAVTYNQLHIIEDIRDCSKNALTPLQRLERQNAPSCSFCNYAHICFKQCWCSIF